MSFTPQTLRDPSAEGGGGSALRRKAYLHHLYSEERRPPSSYNLDLAKHLTDSVLGGTGQLLDIGCGRGDLLRAFAGVGHEVKGIDISPAAEELCCPHDVAIADLEQNPLPFPERSFDFVFSKSVIEHMQNPLPMLESARAALRPGGKAIIMTPSWLHHRWGPFYLDFTHVTPFTAPSLHDAMSLAGFEAVTVRHFRQLPFLWKLPLLSVPVWFFSKLPLPYQPMYQMKWSWPPEINKLIRFSKEVMLLGVGSRPAS